MVNCPSNDVDEEKITVLYFSVKEHLRKIMTKCVNRKSWKSTNSSYYASNILKTCINRKKRAINGFE